MPADLKNPFGESCCDGGVCNIEDMSAQPCGCDKGAKWECEQHRCNCYPWEGNHAIDCPKAAHNPSPDQSVPE